MIIQFVPLRLMDITGTCYRPLRRATRLQQTSLLKDRTKPIAQSQHKYLIPIGLIKNVAIKTFLQFVQNIMFYLFPPYRFKSAPSLYELNIPVKTPTIPE
jgi:hypothetical protein